MFNDVLVISDAFVEPPSEIMAVRTITMIAHCNLGMDILLHSTQENLILQLDETEGIAGLRCLYS